MIIKMIYLSLRYTVMSSKLKLYFWPSEPLYLLIIKSGLENMLVLLDYAPEYFRKMR